MNELDKEKEIVKEMINKEMYLIEIAKKLKKEIFWVYERVPDNFASTVRERSKREKGKVMSVTFYGIEYNQSDKDTIRILKILHKELRSLAQYLELELVDGEGNLIGEID